MQAPHSPAVALVPGLAPDRAGDTDVVCGVCDERAPLHPAERVGPQVRLFLEQHPHAVPASARRGRRGAPG